jgi:hypothetical protein
MNPSAPIFDFRFAILDYKKPKPGIYSEEYFFMLVVRQSKIGLSLRLIRLWRKSTKIQN